MSVQGFSQTIDDFDAVVIAVGRRPANDLVAQIGELPDVNVLVIGDAERPALALDAICRGAAVALNL
jgi:hypothetical protein